MLPSMQHPIDPKIDCVFKALLGSEANRRLLVHFLNAVLGADLPAPVVEVVLLNPYNEREFLGDKLSVVDVKARDEAGRIYQVEIQILVFPNLPARILYGWADLYSAQLASGQDYGDLKPTYAIWLLGEALLPDRPGYAHRFRFRDEAGRGLVEHGEICLLELAKFGTGEVHTEEQRWLKFFNEGERLDEGRLPEWMQTEEMRQAMGTLKEFSEKERSYHAYQARQNYLRQQRSIERRIQDLTAEAAQARAEKECEREEKERERAEKERERAEKEQALAEKERALAEGERLKRLMKGDPSA